MSSQAVAAMIGVGGVLTGLVGERLLRVLGRLWCEPSGWELRFVDHDPTSPRYLDTDIPPEQATAVEYSTRLDLFNEKEIPVGLRDVSIVFVCADGKKLVSKPVDAASAVHRQGRTTYTPLHVINLPPRQFVHKELTGSFGQEGASTLASGRWQRVEFVGARPSRPVLGILGSKTYRKVIADLREHS